MHAILFHCLKGIELFITQDVPHFRLIANGCGGSTSVDIHQDSPVMDTFLCTEDLYITGNLY